MKGGVRREQKRRRRAVQTKFRVWLATGAKERTSKWGAKERTFTWGAVKVVDTHSFGPDSDDLVVEGDGSDLEAWVEGHPNWFVLCQKLSAE